MRLHVTHQANAVVRPCARVTSSSPGPRSGPLSASAHGRCARTSTTLRGGGPNVRKSRSLRHMRHGTRQGRVYLEVYVTSRACWRRMRMHHATSECIRAQPGTVCQCTTGHDSIAPPPNKRMAYSARACVTTSTRIRSHDASQRELASALDTCSIRPLQRGAASQSSSNRLHIDSILAKFR